jgi:ferritin-like metal-binding protein YciE
MKNSNEKDAQNSTTENAAKEQNPAEKGMRDLFLSELKGAYWTEKAMVKALPEMIKQTSSHRLRKTLEGHLEITKKQVTAMEDVFSLAGGKAEAVKNEAASELVKEAEKKREKNEPEMVTDSRVILAALRLEHYEIATYGTLCSFAKNFGENHAAALLHKILDEEKDANEKLSEIVESIQFEMAEVTGGNHHPLAAKKKSKEELN